MGKNKRTTKARIVRDIRFQNQSSRLNHLVNNTGDHLCKGAVPDSWDLYVSSQKRSDGWVLTVRILTKKTVFTYSIFTSKLCTYLTYHQFDPENPIGSGRIVRNMGNSLNSSCKFTPYLTGVLSSLWRQKVSTTFYIIKQKVKLHLQSRTTSDNLKVFEVIPPSGDLKTSQSEVVSVYIVLS